MQTRSKSFALQDLLGVVADLDWDATTGALSLTASCSLPASTPLTPLLTAVGADPDHLIMTHGLAALAWWRAQKAGQRQQAVQLPLQGQGIVQLPWQTPYAASFQLCIEPPEEDECRSTKLQLLAASALGTAHALTPTSSQVRPAITLIQCCCLGQKIQVALHCFMQHAIAIPITTDQTFLVIVYAEAGHTMFLRGHWSMFASITGCIRQTCCHRNLPDSV